MTSTDTTIREIQERFDRAELHDDRETLSELIDQEFLSIGPKGFLLDKQQWIDRPELFTYHELDVSEVDIRLFADTAIVRAVQRNRSTSHGHDVHVSTRSATSGSAAGAWRLAGIQSAHSSTPRKLQWIRPLQLIHRRGREACHEQSHRRALQPRTRLLHRRPDSTRWKALSATPSPTPLRYP